MFAKGLSIGALKDSVNIFKYIFEFEKKLDGERRVMDNNKQYGVLEMFSLRSQRSPEYRT